MAVLRWLPALVLLTALAALVGGCGSEEQKNTASAEELYQAGLEELEDDLFDADTEGPPWTWDVDVSDAYHDFDEALDQDPTHCGALLGASLTRLLMVVTDPGLGVIMDGLFPEEQPLGRRAPLFWYMQTPDLARFARRIEALRRDEFAFSELQEFIEDEALPALDEVDARLDAFEGMNCEVVLILEIPDSASLRSHAQRDTTIQVEIDATDAYFVHAPLDVVQAALNVLCSYNVDIEEGQSPQHLIELDDDFLTLRGGSFMPTAYDELSEAVDHLGTACDELEAEADPQTDDLVTLTDGWLPLDEIFGEDPLATIREAVRAADEALASGLSFNPSDDDPTAPDIDVVVDLDELFNDPLEDLRDYVPAHDWPTQDSMRVHRPIAFPDPTFDDITPGMANEEWETIIQWTEESE